MAADPQYSDRQYSDRQYSDRQDPEHPGPDDHWSPERYHQFREQRSKPFFDLLEMVRPIPGGAMLDLGCGSGELTASALERVDAATAIGIDASPAMLERAARLDIDGLDFRTGDLSDLAETPDTRTVDLIVANASLQWVPDHERVLADWVGRLAPRGQLAVQVPANSDHPSHLTITEVLHEEPFLSATGGEPPPDPVLSVLKPERYAHALWSLGAREQRVRLEVYSMVMRDADEVADWTSGTSLLRARNVLDDELFEAFVARYRELLAQRLDHAAPYFYAFKRILMWAKF